MSQLLPALGRVFPTAAAGLTVALLALVAAAAGGAAPSAGKPPVTPQPAAAPKADGNRDKVFDDLEQRLGGLDGAARVDVIVQLGLPATADRVDAISFTRARAALVRTAI